MADDDYELLPHNEVEQLKNEIGKLKKNPLGDSAQGKDLLEAVNQLNVSIRKLIDIFVNTQTDLAKDYAEHNPSEDLKTIKDQNEEIAKGIVALADMLKDNKKAEPVMFSPAVAPAPYQDYQPPKQSFPDQMPASPKAYPSPYADASFNNDIPPPMKVEDKKRGFFSRK